MTESNQIQSENTEDVPIVETPKHPGGRPTSYSAEMLKLTEEYIESCEDEEEQQLIGLSAKGTELFKQKLRVNIPTIEGLAYELKVNKTTIYEWCKVNPEFSNVIDDLRAKQARALITKGLSGDYNPTIAKVLLTKHGYREGIDATTNDKDLLPDQELKNKIDQGIKSFLNGYTKDPL